MHVFKSFVWVQEKHYRSFCTGFLCVARTTAGTRKLPFTESPCAYFGFVNCVQARSDALKNVFSVLWYVASKVDSEHRKQLIAQMESNRPMKDAHATSASVRSGSVTQNIMSLAPHRWVLTLLEAD